MDYRAFLAHKRVIASPVGIDISETDINPALFPFQVELVSWALRKGRAALFADTGLGKTFMQLEWAKGTGERTLVYDTAVRNLERARSSAQLPLFAGLEGERAS